MMISELTTHQKVSPKLGVKDVDPSGSRAQLTALEPLDSNMQLSLSLLPALAKEKQMDPKSRLVLKISLTFGGEMTLDLGDSAPKSREQRLPHRITYRQLENRSKIGHKIASHT